MHFVEVKSILSAKNGMNIYRGCTHGCIYCDSRSDCYQMPHAFEDIEVKKNALILLEEQLRKKRKPCMIGTGAMSDPYNPFEEKLLYTRHSLKLINKYGFGATVLTKSDLILRDLDLLSEINKKTKAVVQMTLTTASDSLCRIIEPNVCPTSKRLLVLEACKTRGIPTVVWLCPVLPYITDTEENIKKIVEACAAAGVRGIICFDMGLTLRSGNREYFYHALDKSFPGLKERYIKAYGSAYSLPSPNRNRLMRMFYELCAKYGMETDINRLFSYLSAFECKNQGEQLAFF